MMYEINIIIVILAFNLIMVQFTLELIRILLIVICIHFVHVHQIETINVSFSILKE